MDILAQMIELAQARYVIANWQTLKAFRKYPTVEPICDNTMTDGVFYLMQSARNIFEPLLQFPPLNYN